MIGALGGAAKLNQTILSSMTQDEALPLLFDTEIAPLFDTLPDPCCCGCDLLQESLTSLSSFFIFSLSLSLSPSLSSSLSLSSFGLSENLILFSVNSQS